MKYFTDVMFFVIPILGILSIFALYKIRNHIYSKLRIVGWFLFSLGAICNLLAVSLNSWKMPVPRDFPEWERFTISKKGGIK